MGFPIFYLFVYFWGETSKQQNVLLILLSFTIFQDKDVARLQDFQELEVVLEKAEGLSLFSSAGGLTDRPCYNMKASRLTY